MHWRARVSKRRFCFYLNYSFILFFLQEMRNEDYENVLQMDMLLNKMRKMSEINTDDNDIKQTVYFLINTLRQRNKRFTKRKYFITSILL